MIKGKKVTAIILVAGNSTRFGKNTNKNLEIIKEKPIFIYSLAAFAKNEYIDNIIVTVKEADRIKIKETIEKQNLKKEIKIILGGATRQESVYHSIKNTKADIVIVHDGARPAIKQRYIYDCIESMEEFKGATIGVKSKDTIKIADDNNIITFTTKRSNTWLIQTPQCFDRKVLLDMHEKFKNEEVTDDCMLLEKNDYKIKILEGDYTNIKVTTAEDIDIVRKFV